MTNVFCLRCPNIGAILFAAIGVKVNFLEGAPLQKKMSQDQKMGTLSGRIISPKKRLHLLALAFDSTPFDLSTEG